MKYRAVLFDLDGTLLDTLADLTDAMNVALVKLGCPIHTAQECRFFVGDGVTNYALRALPESRRDEASVAECVKLMRAHYREHWADKTQPYDGIRDLLKALAASVVTTAVLSNKPDDFTQAVVARYFADTSFAAVRGARSGAALKPDPAAALEIAQQIRIAADEFLYVGDTDTDMQTARAAGMFAVGAVWGFRPPEELLANGAQSLIARPSELLKLL